MTASKPLPTIRSAFLAAQHTLPNIRRDFPEWHLGRPTYALWAIDLDSAEVRNVSTRAAEELQDCLLDDYRRQPHVTLALCGFPAAQATQPDDFSAAQLKAQIATLNAHAPAPFPLTVSQLASFSSAPFLLAEDPGGHLCRLHHRLQADQRFGLDGAYTPHVTIGLYRAVLPTHLLQRRLDRVMTPTLEFTVEHLDLMSYQAAEIGGPLTTLGHFDLQTRSFIWQRRPEVWQNQESR